MTDEQDRDDLIRETAAVTSLITSPLPELAHIHRDDVDPVSRDVYLGGEIEADDGTAVLQTLRYLERTGTAPVRVWINSPGGDVMAMFVMHDAIRASNVPVYTIGCGEVASAAGLILACGHRRFVTESTVFMTHETKLLYDEEGVGLRAARDRRAYEDWQHEYWAELMGRYAKGGKAFWRSKVERGGEHWLLGGQAIVEAGIADAIWTSSVS